MNLLLANVIKKCLVSFIVLYSSADYNYKKEKFIFYENYIAQSHAEKIYDAVEINGKPDLDLISIAWVESRFKKNIKRGDRGKACGQFQMHARVSYPQFVRKSWKNWDEQNFHVEIEKECKKLENVKYGAAQAKKLVKLLKRKNLPICRYNSGVKRKCTTRYAKKVQAIRQIFKNASYSCEKFTRSVH